jgi:hypothetical protein
MTIFLGQENGFEISEDIQEAYFEPACNSQKSFYDALFKNHFARYSGSEELRFMDSGEEVNSRFLAYHHISGATVCIGKDRVLIAGTKKAIDDSCASLELLTERRLEEVGRKILIAA